MSAVFLVCNVMAMQCKFSYNSLRSALMKSPKSYLYNFIKQSTSKNTSICEEVENKNLQVTGEHLLNLLKKARSPEEVILKCPISNQDDKTTILKFMSLMQIPPGVNFDQTKEVLDWWLKLKAAEELQDQAYDEKRVQLHGPDSAATHFFIDRHASVRLKDSNEWIIGGRPTLKRCVSGYFVQAERGERDYRVEAVDCTNFHNNGIRYEGLEYLKGLKHLKELILRDQVFIDAFCLDRIAGQNGRTLEYLDLTGCELDVGCIIAIDKMEALRTLVVSEPSKKSDLWFDLMCLKRRKPRLNVKMVDDWSPRRLYRKSLANSLLIKPNMCRSKTPPTAMKQPFN